MPSSSPESPKCDVLSSTSIYVTWSPPPANGQNGKVRGYRVSYIANDELYDSDMLSVKSTNQYLTVENLKKFTNYSIWVLAYTKVGDGKKTPQFFCRTHEDGTIKTNSLFFLNEDLIASRSYFFFFFFISVPSAPQDIKAIPASSTKIIVSWLPPIYPNGDIVSCKKKIRIETQHTNLVDEDALVISPYLLFRLLTRFICPLLMVAERRAFIKKF